jgi:hypothetical protein
MTNIRKHFRFRWEVEDVFQNIFTLNYKLFFFCLRRKQFSGMWRRVYIVLTDVSEERIVSSFRVEENPRARNQREQVLTD